MKTRILPTGPHDLERTLRDAAAGRIPDALDGTAPPLVLLAVPRSRRA